jgi:UDP-2,3-diacylglucosamine pyrophosphatase LpxH
VSDLHLGSPYSQDQAFLRFLATLPTDSALILNGDILDKPQMVLPPAHRVVLSQLKQESYSRQVVWVHGNHDPGYILENRAQITFAESFGVEDQLLVMHGHAFDLLMPKSRLFIQLFATWHRFRLRWGAQPRHVADYAKTWPTLYQVLTRHVRRNAVQWARAQGFAAITCGHTHYPEDIHVDGIRYLNTGSWTETPNFCVSLTSHGPELQRTDQSRPQPKEQNTEEREDAACSQSPLVGALSA